MNPDTPITILPVKNGFIVTEKPNENSFTCTSSGQVFQSFAELNHFLSKHFTYRKHDLQGDVPQEEPSKFI